MTCGEALQGQRVPEPGWEPAAAPTSAQAATTGGRVLRAQRLPTVLPPAKSSAPPQAPQGVRRRGLRLGLGGRDRGTLVQARLTGSQVPVTGMKGAGYMPTPHSMGGWGAQANCWGHAAHRGWVHMASPTLGAPAYRLGPVPEGSRLCPGSHCPPPRGRAVLAAGPPPTHSPAMLPPEQFS